MAVPHRNSWSNLQRNRGVCGFSGPGIKSSDGGATGCSGSPSYPSNDNLMRDAEDLPMGGGYRVGRRRAAIVQEEDERDPVPQEEDEREPLFIQAHDPNYVPEPIYPEYIPLEDDHEFPAEEQPLPPIDSPTTESPGYVTESDPEEDPEGYEDDETEGGPVDYPMDGGDDGDDDDGDSSGDDARDEDEDVEDEEDEEEEEHLAPADSTTVIPADEPIFPPEGTEPAIPPLSTNITKTWYPTSILQTQCFVCTWLQILNHATQIFFSIILFLSCLNLSIQDLHREV
ncbi:hypothetical protein Tco_0438110 [Tanacetum coccineum]